MAKKGFMEDGRRAFQQDNETMKRVVGWSDDPPQRRYYGGNTNINDIKIRIGDTNPPQPVYDPYEAKRRDDAIRAQAAHSYKVKMEFLKVFKSKITLKSLIIITILSVILTVILPTKSMGVISAFIGSFFMFIFFIAIYCYFVAAYRVIMRGVR